jgi:regulator of protease activity HflC (stomatin/prohibitin superfamily)
MIREKEMKAAPGGLGVTVLLATIIGSCAMAIRAIPEQPAWTVAAWFLLMCLAAFSLAGLTVVNPNEAKVVQLLGTYKGSIKEQGLWLVNPLTRRRRVSLRIRNFESGRLKVNDHDGNPIEIAAVVVWKVVDSAEAIFQVDDFEHFVHVQSEAALRNLATQYPYDSHAEGDMSLRMSLASATWRTRPKSRVRCCGGSRQAR